MEVVEEVEPEPSKVALRAHAATGRPKGSYRLADFIIQRTLGTGSFGRVHLGKLCQTSLSHADIDTDGSTKQTQLAFLRDESLE